MSASPDGCLRPPPGRAGLSSAHSSGTTGARSPRRGRSLWEGADIRESRISAALVKRVGVHEFALQGVWRSGLSGSLEVSGKAWAVAPRSTRGAVADLDNKTLDRRIIMTTQTQQHIAQAMRDGSQPSAEQQIANVLAQGLKAPVRVGPPTVDQAGAVTWPVQVTVEGDFLPPVTAPEEKRPWDLELSCSPQPDGSRRVTLLAPHSVFSCRGSMDSWADLLTAGQLDVVLRNPLLDAGLEPGLSASITVPNGGTELNGEHLVEVSRRLDAGVTALRDRDLELDEGEAAEAERESADQEWQEQARLDRGEELMEWEGIARAEARLKKAESACATAPAAEAEPGY